MNHHHSWFLVLIGFWFINQKCTYLMLETSFFQISWSLSSFIIKKNFTLTILVVTLNYNIQTYIYNRLSSFVKRWSELSSVQTSSIPIKLKNNDSTKVNRVISIWWRSYHAGPTKSSARFFNYYYLNARNCTRPRARETCPDN